MYTDDSNRQQSKVIDPDPLCWLEFTEESIITSCKSGRSTSDSAEKICINVLPGHIRTWDRPRDGSNESDLASSST
jgi:hypothetical protein